jgi:CO/xanthine dehydrogenase FAD-binding subunit
MDLHTVSEIVCPTERADLRPWRSGDAFLGGGTWLFSEPQPAVTRLVDLGSLGWPDLEISADGLRIGATCTLGVLAAADLPFRAGPLFVQCCRALLGSFKIWNAATVGGNLCMALPAGPMAALAVALEARCVIWCADGGERVVAARDFILGPQMTVLAPGEILRAIEIPAAALGYRTAFRQISLTPAGGWGALVVGAVAADGGFGLTVTAATRRPVRLDFAGVPGTVAAALEAAIPETLYYDDIHGLPDWRRHVVHRLAAEICRELAA